MTDTVRTIAYILANNLADNQAPGSITPGKMRETVVSVSPNETTLTFAPSLTWNLATDPVALVTITGNITITIINGEAGRAYRLAVIQGAPGTSIPTFVGATALGSPSYRTGVGAVNLISLDIVGSTIYFMVV